MSEDDGDEVDTYHAWDCSPAELTAEIERLKADNAPTREEILELANTLVACGATRLAGVLRRGIELEAEIERLKEKCDELFADKERWYRMAELHCSTIAQLKADNERLRKALEMVAALPGFEPEEPYGQAVLGALMSKSNYINNEDKT